MTSAKYLGLTANQLAKVVSDLEAENSKLRELVSAYQEVAEYPTCRLYDECKPHPFSATCAECDGESCLIQRLTDELRELGAEVPDD